MRVELWLYVEHVYENNVRQSIFLYLFLVSTQEIIQRSAHIQCILSLRTGSNEAVLPTRAIADDPWLLWDESMHDYSHALAISIVFLSCRPP